MKLEIKLEGEKNVKAHRHAAGGDAEKQSAETNIVPQPDAAQNSGGFGAAPCSACGDGLSERLMNKLTEMFCDPTIGTNISESDITIQYQSTVPKKLFEMLTSPQPLQS